MKLNESARGIIIKAMRRERSRGEVCRIYQIPPEIVESYLENRDCGTLYAREVIRLEIGRIAALKRGERFKPTPQDRYKGTR
jgi:hypothetical protein